MQNAAPQMRVVVTAGGTYEPIDPVRVISNLSTGRMGFSLAAAAVEMGCGVHLVTTASPPPIEGTLRLTSVATVAQMREAVLDACRHADLLIMAAAVSDFRVARVAPEKIKKTGEAITLQLVQTEDFLLEIPDNVVKVGFAAESRDLLINAAAKLKAKNLAFICANDISEVDAGFGSDTNRVTILYPDGRQEAFPLMSKRDIGRKIVVRAMEEVEKRWLERRTSPPVDDWP